MSKLSRKLLKITSILKSEKSSFAFIDERASLIRLLWKDIGALLKHLVSGYSNFGEKHLHEFEQIESYKATIKANIDPLKLLLALASLSHQLGEFYVSQALITNKSLHERFTAFSEEIDEFKKHLKESSQKIIKESNKIAAEMKVEQAKIERLLREHEEINGFSGYKGKRVEDDRVSEKKAGDPKLDEEIKQVEIKFSYLEHSFTEKIGEVHELFENLVKKIIQLEQKYSENVESAVMELVHFSLSMIEYKKNTTERFSQLLLSISPHKKPEINSTDPSIVLRDSDSKIESLIFIKDYLVRTTENEESIDRQYSSYKKTALSYTDTSNILPKTLAYLKKLEEFLLSHSIYAKTLKNDIIKPIESTIRLQTALTSSIRISLKKITISYQKAESSKLNSPNRLNSSFEKNSGRSNKLYKNQLKEITSLLSDHLANEDSYFLSIKSQIGLISEKTTEAYAHMKEVYRKIIESSRGLKVETSFLYHSVHSNNPELTAESPYIDSLTILKENSRNDFKPNTNLLDSSEDEELYRRFIIDRSEYVISSYLCAYAEKILLQGKLYITPNYLCFYSYFNSSTLIGKETSLLIPLAQIEKLYKRYHVYIFDNSIELLTSNKSYFFTSFLSRDDAFSILHRLVLLHSKVFHLKSSPVEFIVNAHPSRLNLRKIIRDVKDPFAGMFPDSYFTVTVFEKDLEFELSIQDMYKKFYSNENKDFYRKYFENCGDALVEVTDWSVQPPSYFLGLPGTDWSNSATRVVKNHHKLKERLPLMPTHCLLIEKQTIYFMSPEKFVIESEFDVDAPYGEYFHSYFRWTITGNERVSISAKYGMVFNSYTIFHGKILKEGTKETLETLNNIWRPLANSIIKGEKAETKAEAPENLKKEQKLEINWALWISLFMLLLIIFKLWQKIKFLESEIEKLKH